MKQNCSFFYLPSLFKTQKKQLIWDPFFYGCPRAVKLNNTSKMVSYDRQTRHQCIVLHRLLSNFFWWSHWTLTSNYIYSLHAFSSGLQIVFCVKYGSFSYVLIKYKFSLETGFSSEAGHHRTLESWSSPFECSSFHWFFSSVLTLNYRIAVGLHLFIISTFSQAYALIR